MLRIEIERRDGVCVVRFEGRMTAGLDQEYLNERAEAAKREAGGGLVADLGGVAAIGSSGIGMLVRLYSSAKHAGGRFVIAAAQERVRAVLEFTRVATIIPVVADVTEGIAAVRQVNGAGAAG
jgi:anti-sigma B factor antagonist